jgi:uncharacterized protein YhfF
MKIPSNVQAMWSEYSDLVGGVEDERFYEAFSFGDSPTMADELAQLVVSGVKRATAGAVWAYAAGGQPLPKPGDLSVVLDAQDRPLCIIETTQVDVLPFDKVSADFAATEGEGDGSLVYWREVHVAFFTRECEQSGRTFSTSMEISCERFRVVYPVKVMKAAAE